MTGQWRTIRLSLLIIAALALGTARPAAALDYNDILGAWCSASAKITFTRDEMRVTLFSDNRTTVSKVTSYEFNGDVVKVNWVDSRQEEVWANFGEFSADNKIMYLQKNDVAPHRQYKRC